MEEQKNMKDIFCARCQGVTAHKGSVDSNGEFLFECAATTGEIEEITNQVGEVQHKDVVCGRFVKLPADTTPETFAHFLNNHKEVNTGQVILDGQEKTLTLLLDVQPEAPVVDSAPVENVQEAETVPETPVENTPEVSAEPFAPTDAV